MKPPLLTLFAGLLAFGQIAYGQKNAVRQDPFQHPFANPVDDPSLPRVLMIGDSISIGYTPRVRRLLRGKANVHRPTTNCRWSAFGAEHVDEWVGDSHWDVIHFNFGLWDWYGWSQDVKATPESYAKSLKSIVTQLKKTNAKLIFAITTPPCVGPEKKVKIVIKEQRAREFNEAARAVMKQHGVQINDLYATIGKNRAKYQRGENDVHYTEEGRDVLAAQVATTIGSALPKDHAVAAAIGTDVQPAPENCPACAMGLTAGFVFKRLDADEDKLITVSEFMRSPGMQKMAKARKAVGRLDKSGDGKLSWKELETAYKARHANCEKPDSATLPAKAHNVRPDGRGDGSRFAQVFILRSDQDGDGKISKEEFQGPDFGFNRLDKNQNGWIEADELGDLHQRRLNDPKSMKERLESGDVPKPPPGKRPKVLSAPAPTKE